MNLKRRWQIAWIALAVTMVLLVMGFANMLRDSGTGKPTPAEQAVVTLAKQMDDTSPQPNPAAGRSHLANPSSEQEILSVLNWWFTEDALPSWNGYLAGHGWPVANGLALRLLVLGQSGTTKCPWLNSTSTTVASTGEQPFFCPSDGAGGTIWWPLTTELRHWHDLPVTGVTVLQAKLQRLMAEVTIRNIYQAISGQLRYLPPPSHVADLLPLSFCMAGAAARSRMDSKPNAAAMVAQIYHLRIAQVLDPPYRDANQALQLGLNQQSIGRCVRDEWPLHMRNPVDGRWGVAFGPAPPLTLTNLIK